MKHTNVAKAYYSQIQGLTGRMQEAQLTNKLSAHSFSRERLFYLLGLRKMNGHRLGWLSKNN
jgi:hypothetical protein